MTSGASTCVPPIASPGLRPPGSAPRPPPGMPGGVPARNFERSPIPGFSPSTAPLLAPTAAIAPRGPKPGDEPMSLLILLLRSVLLGGRGSSIFSIFHLHLKPPYGSSPQQVPSSFVSTSG